MMERMRDGISSKPSRPERFTFTVEFTDPGAGAWTFQIANGKVELWEGKADYPDFVMTTSLTIWFEMASEKIGPLKALITGKIKIGGFRNMRAFTRLTAPPGLDDIIGPIS
jgi:putative sterol carrier protein